MYLLNFSANSYEQNTGKISSRLIIVRWACTHISITTQWYTASGKVTPVQSGYKFHKKGIYQTIKAFRIVETHIFSFQ